MTLTASGPIIDLDAAELRRADAGARERYKLRDKLGDAGGVPNLDRGAREKLGARGELAFALWAGLPWSPRQFGRFDAGNVQVRTRGRREYELLVQDRAHDEDVFVLVLPADLLPLPSSYLLRGWMRAGDAKRKVWRFRHGGYKPAFFVPQSELEPMEMFEMLPPGALSYAGGSIT